MTKTMLAPNGVETDQVGAFVAVVAATVVPDLAREIIDPGVLSASLQRQKLALCAGHDLTKPCGRIDSAHELAPGHPDLPEPVRAAGAGGLVVQGAFNLNTEAGNDWCHTMRFVGAENQGFSIGYSVLESYYDDDGFRHLTGLDVVECSPVVLPAQPLARGIAVKSRRLLDRLPRRVDAGVFRTVVAYEIDVAEHG